MKFSFLLFLLTGCFPKEEAPRDRTIGEPCVGDPCGDADTSMAPELVPDGVKVLVLDDGAGSATDIAAQLVLLGHDAVVGPMYNEWDGSNPSVPDADAVLVLQGQTTDPPVSVDASAALVSASLAGAGLVRCGLAARIAATTTTPSNTDLVLPVEDEPSTSTDSEWWVLQRDHAIASGLSSRWTETGRVYGTQVKPDLDIAVIAEARGSFGTWPTLVVRKPSSGPRQVYVNSAFGGDGSTPSALAASLLDNAVRWAASDL